MKTNKPILLAIATMIMIYLLISFITWDINAHNWDIMARVSWALWSPIFSLLVYISFKNEE